MNKPVPIRNAEKLIFDQEVAFTDLANVHKAVDFKTEAMFALQLLKKNDFLLNTAINNPDSLKNAITNIAAIGLSLNPASKHAYLVPRDRTVCLDVSYMGMIHLACESGSIQWVQAEIVKENDKFVFKGVGQKPEHEMDPFSERGKIKGAYCVAKTTNFEYLTCVMSIKEIYDIKKRSKAQKGPWSTDEGEMIKKTVIKRAAKTWPKVETFQRIDKAIEVVNQHEGIDFDAPKEKPKDSPDVFEVSSKKKESVDAIADFMMILTEDFTLPEKGAFMVEHLGVRKFSELNEKEFDELTGLIKKLAGMVKNKKESEEHQKRDVKNATFTLD